MMTRIAERMYGTMREQTDAIDASYKVKIDAASARSGTVSGRLRDANNVLQGVENGKEQVSQVKQFLRDMKMIVAKAKNNPAAAEFYSEKFNDKIKEINSAVNRYSGDFNTVGRPDEHTLLPDEKVIQVSDFGGNLELQGLYAGTSFNITGTGDSAGLFYQNKPTSDTMYKVDDIGDDDAISVVGHSQGRITNVVVGADDSISFDVDGGESSFTGTLNRGGMELMPSWFYEGLATEDGIDAAKQAIRDAEAHLRDVSFSLTRIKIDLDPAVRRLQTEKDELLETMTSLSGEQFSRIAEIEDATRRQYDAVESSLNVQVSALGGYTALLGASGQGSFVDLLS